jgi:hypothetical protein
MDRRTPQPSRQPNEFIRKVAQAYNYEYRLGTIIKDLYVAVDVHRARRIADLYEALPVDDSGNPAVCKAYHQLGEEIKEQWDFAIKAAGMTFEPWMRAGQPYPNSVEMCRDIRRYRHLYFYQGGNPHPLLGKADPATGLSLNDKFRAIHDLFGHAAEGYGFGPWGEESAWLKHSQMFSREAQKALTTETRGQNSWVNFGVHNYDSAGNHKNIPLQDRPYAVQKVALLPAEVTDFKAVIESVLQVESISSRT